ncbi:MAG: hypothetical protein LBC64_08130 [Fibromonadaceae bacterium]|jgi:transcription elongation factor Elf1|nr:hypothetical protein [Fibromonadaceae bacterium]
MIPEIFDCPICTKSVEKLEDNNYGISREGGKHAPLFLFKKYCSNCGYEMKFIINEKIFNILSKELDEYWAGKNEAMPPKNLFASIKEFFCGRAK